MSQDSSNLNASHFTDYFKAINNPDSVFFQPDDEILDFKERNMKEELQTMFGELNIEISNHEILKASKELSLGKASGSDFVLNEFFKYGIDILIDYLGRLFNVVFNKGYFPEKWTEGFILPLHKKGGYKSG